MIYNDHFLIFLVTQTMCPYVRNISEFGWSNWSRSNRGGTRQCHAEIISTRDLQRAVDFVSGVVPWTQNRFAETIRPENLRTVWMLHFFNVFAYIIYIYGYTVSTLYTYLHQTFTSDAEILKQEHLLCPFAQAACSHAYPGRPSVTKVSSEVSTLGAADRVLLGGYSQGLTCCTLHGCFQTFPSCNLPHFSIFCLILPRS